MSDGAPERKNGGAGDPGRPTTGLLDEFTGFIKDTKGLLLWVIAAGLTGTVIAQFAGLTPPWPSNITAITCIAEILVFIMVFLHYRSSGRKVVAKAIGRSITLLAAALVGYVLLNALFVFEAQTTGERLVGGFACTRAAAQLYENCPFIGHEELAQATYEPEMLWTRQSIGIVQTTLVALWVILFCAFVFAASTFVLYARRRR